MPACAYIGVRIGLNDFTELWTMPLEKYCRRPSFLSQHECGLHSDPVQLQCLAMGVLTYIVQFFAPTAAVWRRQRAGLQVAIGGPRHSLHPGLLYRLRESGCPVQAVDVARDAAAAQHRLVRCS
eukprot:9130309-Pyramimonas_sp.AAC.1